MKAAGATRPASFARRFIVYQRERFPLAGFAPLICAFAFSSAAFSRLARGQREFIPWPRFALGAFTTLVIFFLLRVLDEHKDADQDLRYRPELPVPRGLVSLRELRRPGVTAGAIAVLLNALFTPYMLLALAGVAAWAVLMTKEFYVRDWLRAHPASYLLTHMAILPLVDVYTTGLDWIAERVPPPSGLIHFLAVTFMNGILIEIGRKVRAPSGEREGVDTYSRAWGLRPALAWWSLSLAAAVAFAIAASRATGQPLAIYLLLPMVAVLCATPAVAFVKRPEARTAKGVEVASQLWPLMTYLILGAVPFVIQWLGRHSR